MKLVPPVRLTGVVCGTLDVNYVLCSVTPLPMWLTLQHAVTLTIAKSRHTSGQHWYATENGFAGVHSSEQQTRNTAKRLAKGTRFAIGTFGSTARHAHSELVRLFDEAGFEQEAVDGLKALLEKERDVTTTH